MNKEHAGSETGAPNENTNMKNITVIHHSADFDGLFCREIARRFLGDSAEYIGWDFADKPLEIPESGTVYVMDLPVDRVFGGTFVAGKRCDWPEGTSMHVQQEFVDMTHRLVWIDHHASSIVSHPEALKGYRIDGVAACRLAWQWFSEYQDESVWIMPIKQMFIDRAVKEPYAVQLAGEYDVWDKRNPSAEVFQFGLRSRELVAKDWKWLLTVHDNMKQGEYDLGMTGLAVDKLLQDGRLLQRYQQGVDKVAMERSCIVEFEGLKFLALNTARCNSLTFAAKDVPETGHDALMGFFWKDHQWSVSLYHARHRTDIDLSKIAVKHGGGGHRGACGFQTGELEFAGEMATASPTVSPDEKAAYLFYYDEGEDCWSPAPRLVEEIISAETLSVGDIESVDFKRYDMTPAEFAAIPEV